MRSRTVWTLACLAVVAALSVTALMRFNLTALEAPGRLETVVSDHARRFLVQRASRNGVPSPPADMKARVRDGEVLYGLDCGMCHGSDGRGQTAMGRWMYPRAADLTREETQSYSDPELFWIIQNGIRLTGMPAFGKVESDERIWSLVSYLRTLHDKSRQTHPAR